MLDIIAILTAPILLFGLGTLVFVALGVLAHIQ